MPRPRCVSRSAARELAVAALGALAACAPRRPAEARALRVLVLNMHAGADARGVPNLAAVATLVRDTRADVVLLQEVDSATTRSGGVDQVAELRRLSGYAGAFGPTLRYQGGGYGIAVLARAPILRQEMLRLPVTPAQQRAGGSYEPRGALHVALLWGGDTLHVLDTHLDPSGDDHYRRQEAATLVAVAARLAAGGRPVLVGGDMNSTPESAVQASVRAAGVRDLWPGCGRGSGLSYPAARPVKRIDYLYALGGVRCARAHVLESEASDHRPVLFELRLGAAP